MHSVLVNMDSAPEQCYFNWRFDCRKKKERLICARKDRINNIIRCSKIYGDEKHTELHEKLNRDDNFILKCHKSCVSTYTMNSQIELHKRKKIDEIVVPCKVTRRSHWRTSTENFDFKKHCFFCGEFCVLEIDKKHPLRWRAAYMCRDIDTKASLLDICGKRDDDFAKDVKCRLQIALSDLHAADARYHVDCRQRFVCFRSLPGQSVSDRSSEDSGDDKPFESLVDMINVDRSKLWNSVELFSAYTNLYGNKLSKRFLILQLQEKFGSDLLILSSPGIADIIAFRSHASKTLRLVNDDEDERETIAKKASEQIIQDMEDIVIDKEHYKIGINKEIIKDSASNFMMKILAKVSPKLDNTLPALLICSIVTSAMKRQATCLQVALAGKMLESKKLINSMYSYGVSCSYKEYRRFKKSASQAAVSNLNLTGISNAEEGLVQAIVDNFDADISSQNGRQSTHSLAILLTQHSNNPEEEIVEDFLKVKRISTDSSNIPYDVEIHRYQGHKQPDMPSDGITKAVWPLKSLANQALAVRRATVSDWNFFQDIFRQNNCPEFNGYNTKRGREQGHCPQSKTKVFYLPLIDMKPSDPDTMMTAMMKVQELTSRTGQNFSVLTCDQQLYRVAVKVSWSYPSRFQNMYLRLGGMHALMSFVGAIGSLMAESGISDILSGVFGGVPKMLSGKKFPQNVRALRMMTEVVLQIIMEDRPNMDADGLMTILNATANQSRTSKLWIEVLIKPVLLMMAYIRAEREGDWILHLTTFRKMLPYYFAAGHVNYARYGLYYLRSMEKLPPQVQSLFLKGQHITRHIRGIWNGIWSDQFIESTFMRYGHSVGGVIGITLKPDALKIWALSRHICCKLQSDMERMEDEYAHTSKIHLYHKEEAGARIISDTKDRTRLLRTLDTYLHPLNPNEHPGNSIVNIYTGMIAPATVNVDDALNIGNSMLEDFGKTWPRGFHNKISTKVRSMEITSKSINAGDRKMYDLNIIYSRVIALLSSHRDIQVKDVFSYELAPIPTAMFTVDGMRICGAKSILKRSLQVEVSKRTSGDADVTVIDGSALLWTIHWPVDGTVADFIANLKARLHKYLTSSDVYIIFDRYYDYSIKSVARNRRQLGITKKHHLLQSTKLPAQKVVLASTYNKKQLIRILCEDLIGDRLFHVRSTGKYKLVVTGEDQCPIEIKMDERRIRNDLENRGEEADTIIVQQVLECARNAKKICVISDDTDVFVLLLHHYNQAGLSIPLIMESSNEKRAVVDIEATVKKHCNIINNLLPAHAISGCDTVACYYSVGKGSVLKNLKAGHDLSAIGNADIPFEQVVKQATAFISACYGIKNSTDMSHTRLLVWGKRYGKGCVSGPNLATLPPTKESFIENIKRAHLQALLWRNLDKGLSSEFNPVEYGWERDTTNKSLCPINLPEGAKLVPDYILEMIKCGCKSENPCLSNKCGCKMHGLSCTMFCACFKVGCSTLK